MMCTKPGDQRDCPALYVRLIPEQPGSLSRAKSKTAGFGLHEVEMVRSESALV